MKKNFLAGLFRRAESEQEKRINAEMVYRSQERAFRRYDNDLKNSIAKFKSMVCEAAAAGQKANAITAARFVKKMTAIRDKVAGVRQHFEMLHSLSTVSDIMVQFMDTCTALGCDLKNTINIGALTGGQIDMETGLNKLSFVTECVEEAFRHIETALDMESGTEEPAAEEDEALVHAILAEMRPAEAAKPAAPAAGAAFAQPAADAQSADPLGPVTVLPSVGASEIIPDPTDEDIKELERRLSVI